MPNEAKIIPLGDNLESHPADWRNQGTNSEF